jgi:hypothetical protein
MAKFVLLDEEEIKQLFREVLDEYMNKINAAKLKNIPDYDEPLITNLKEIAKLFRCSLPTAQKIKNSIPKDLYKQTGRKFAIRKNVLLQANVDLKRYT